MDLKIQYLGLKKFFVLDFCKKLRLFLIPIHQMLNTLPKDSNNRRNNNQDHPSFVLSLNRSNQKIFEAHG